MTPHFYPVGDGFRFCIFYESDIQPAKGAVLYIHPFAEEMNKSRRMVAKQARCLAEAGYSVLQMDLLGCGDSSGRFEEATWDIWLRDVLLACKYLRSRCQAPITLWGMRAGCLLAVQAAVELSESVNFIFWQPVLTGKQHWQQFLRLKMAGEMASGNSKGAMKEIRTSLAAGGAVDIAGYTITSGLVLGMEDADLFPPSGKQAHVGWIELSNRPGATFSAAAERKVQEWICAGFRVVPIVVQGPVFWQTTEIEDAPALLKATLDALESQL